jgi:subtilisin family serine protease
VQHIISIHRGQHATHSVAPTGRACFARICESSDSAYADGYSLVQGTSFSSPHVAGVVAMLASENPTASVETVLQMLLNTTLKGVMGGVPKGTANMLLHRSCA